MTNIVKHDYHINREDRNIQNNHNSFVIWFTGLSGSGKSTIANKLEKRLFEEGIKVYALDGDNIRSGLSKGLSFTREDRWENNRRISEVAKLFMDAGMIAITAFISPLKEDRDQAKKIIGRENFIEVFINTPLEVCEERDVKGFYKKARAGKIENFTGISAPYEAPVRPDFEIKTEEESVEDAVARLFSFLQQKMKVK
ncbi:adenylyl-sulfate kinase [Salinimicrobium sp. TH3]|uniref:adenylyl-sulfate kinase n=1 Tax=Salinimicrobium sp. TH3 TaxID=2997342 RepID=UPI00227485ED|nr:adenylyl-sulfate kinase [Salinimicrobium sp. TH3]MCY2686932.1 adenylyl-sulfate kinase [Salinimicrobium sp. TH3]